MTPSRASSNSTVTVAHAIAIGILRDRDRAQDAVQQAFMQAWRDLPQLRDRGSLRAVAASTPRSHLLHRRPGDTDAGASTSWHCTVDGPDEPRKGDSTVSVGERDALERAFVGLSPEHRAVVLFHHHIGWTLPECAEILGVPLGTVKSRLYYATRLLRASIAGRGAGRRGPNGCRHEHPPRSRPDPRGMAGRERRPAARLDATRDRHRHPGDPPTAAVVTSCRGGPNP